MFRDGGELRKMALVALSLFMTLLEFVMAVPIDNGVGGQPEIICLQDSMKILVNTWKPFHGHVYVKGMFVNPICHIDLTATHSAEKRAMFEIPYRQCSVVRERSLQPAGLSYTTVAIVQFHHLFLTKVDRAYRLTCFYMETAKTLTQGIHVSMIPTTDIYDTRAMPACTYQVLSDNINGPVVRFAKVGDKVYHKWSCSGGIHGMLVHSCVARDGAGSEYQLLDKQGCAVDPIALGDLSYTGELTTAYVQVHVFKFADQMMVNFQCEITLCVRHGNGCEGVTPPLCNGNDYNFNRGAAGPPYSQVGELVEGPGPFQPPSAAPPPVQIFPPKPPGGPPPVPVADGSQIPIFPPDPLYPPPSESMYPPHLNGPIRTQALPSANPDGQQVSPGGGEQGSPGLVPQKPAPAPPRGEPVTGDTGVLPPAPPLAPGSPDVGPSGPVEGPYPPRDGPYPPGEGPYPPAEGPYPVPVPRTYRPPLYKRDIRKDAPAIGVEDRFGDTMDVTSDDMFVFNLDDALPQPLVAGGNHSLPFGRFYPDVRSQPASSDDVCMTKLTVIQIFVSLVLFFSSMMTVLAFCQRRHYVDQLASVKKETSYR